MGVRELGAVVKKLAPSSVTLYTSLRPFAGKRLAIDANLLTTKFHYANAGQRTPNGVDVEPGEGHRHVRAWFYFLEALRKQDIQPVVVFDGETRVKAKARENERRRKARELQRLRAAAEGDRGDRLREIREVWGQIDDRDRPAVVEAFRTAVEETAPDLFTRVPSAESASRGETATPKHVSPDAAAKPPPSVTTPASPVSMQTAAPSKLPPGVDESTDESAAEQVHEPPSQPQKSDVPGLTALEGVEPKGLEGTSASSVSDGEEPLAPIDLSGEAASAALSMGRTDRITSLVGATSAGAIASHVISLVALFAAYRADTRNPVYSRNQVLVTNDESAFFQSILRAEDHDEFFDDPALARNDVELDDIIARSDKLGESHSKRSDAVPRAAFEEVRRLVGALGIPFLEPSPAEPHEAEGVCSALHALGFVDYVVSEDTDVAVYGAPLLRKISVTEAGTGRAPKEPMNILDPVKLRGELGFTKEEFVDFALLCGTDFTERIPGVGPAKALALIRKHSTIEAILSASDGKVSPPDGGIAAYLQTVRDARSIFLSLPNLPLPPSGVVVLEPSCMPPGTGAPPSVSTLAPTHTPSTFSGSLAPSPPSPALASLLRSYGITRSRYHSGAPAADEDASEDGPVGTDVQLDDWAIVDDRNAAEEVQEALEVNVDEGEADEPALSTDEAHEEERRWHDEAVSAEFERIFLS
ncbi:hypothetical protein JCM3770_006468 [Rhodotorula araucariae]